MDAISALLADPTAWAALATLVVLEVVLGIDNLIFISILSNKLPEHQRARARRIGISLALVMRLILLSGIAWLVGLTAPVFDLGIAGPMGAHGEPTFETQFSWRDLILIAGGLFLLWKATKEIHHNVDPHPTEDVFDTSRVAMSFGSAIVQILLLDLVFSIDSILTAVGMTDHLPIMVVAVLAAVTVMMLAANPLAEFINKNPTVVMLALGFLLMIGAVLIADGFGVHVPKGYIYAAMAFSALVEGLNMLARRRKARIEAGKSGGSSGGAGMLALPLLFATLALEGCGSPAAEEPTQNGQTYVAPVAGSAEQRLALCRSDLATWMEGGMIKGGDVRPEVDRTRWDGMSPVGRTELAEIAACIQSRGEEGEQEVVVVEAGTGAELARVRTPNTLHASQE